VNFDLLCRHIPDTVMKLDSGTAGQRNREFFAMTDPNQFMICEKVLKTLEEENFKTRVASPAQDLAN
jgi:hypothetical protein